MRQTRGEVWVLITVTDRPEGRRFDALVRSVSRMRCSARMSSADRLPRSTAAAAGPARASSSSAAPPAVAIRLIPTCRTRHSSQPRSGGPGCPGRGGAKVSLPAAGCTPCVPARAGRRRIAVSPGHDLL
ncbi:hypothetical protein BWR60_35925 [Inquilinus limosus]|uniref:Uncharacterized protein n=1 Tax=Inquilinus limosus TaxID=171674 RepID=A0A211YS04_9PROT|nr:hypothetical protein BWR60_35925 [Inquilinus limosus]